MKQHEAALLKANAIRLDQARIKKETRALGTEPSRLRLVEMLEDPSDTVQRMTLARFLRCAHKSGPAWAGTLIHSVGVGAHRLNVKVGDLTDRERRAICEQLVGLVRRHRAKLRAGRGLEPSVR